VGKLYRDSLFAAGTHRKYMINSKQTGNAEWNEVLAFVHKEQTVLLDVDKNTFEDLKTEIKAQRALRTTYNKQQAANNNNNNNNNNSK
jgi:hypothetical protein